MASLQFNGALEGLSEKQVQFIREVLEKRGFVNNKVYFEPAGKVGDNFVANVLRITVTVDGGDDFKMIAKIATQDEHQREMMNTKHMFNNEIIMYEQVLPRFKSLQIEAGFPEHERLKYAKCYGCLSEEPYELILLEDLKPLDYVMFDKLAPMNEDAILLVLKSFAVLHSMSFVLKHLEPETYKNYSSRLSSLWDLMRSAQQHINFTAQVEKDALEVLDDEYYKKSIRGVVSQMHTYVDKIKKHENPKNLIIQQGDAWTNNIMFKLNGDKPVDAIMIDYQLAAETSPVADILYFILNCTDHIARSKHYFEWINFYYEQLDKSLSNFGLKANFIYPKDQLDADLRRYSKLFLGTVIMVYSIVSRSPEEAADVHDALKNFDEDKLEAMSMDSLSRDTVTKYKKKLEDLVDSYRHFGYIS